MGRLLIVRLGGWSVTVGRARAVVRWVVSFALWAGVQCCIFSEVLLPCLCVREVRWHGAGYRLHPGTSAPAQTQCASCANRIGAASSVAEYATRVASSAGEVVTRAIRSVRPGCTGQGSCAYIWIRHAGHHGGRSNSQPISRRRKRKGVQSTISRSAEPLQPAPLRQKPGGALSFAVAFARIRS